MSVQRLTTLVLALFVLAATGCTPEEDWTSPEYVQYRLELGDQRAFAEFTRLSPEAQAAMVPTLVEVYNSGVRQENSLQALVSAGDARAKDVFLSALNRTDDNLAGLAARGLAAIGATDASTAVAQRLATVTQHDAYPAFLEALNAIPTPQSADVVAGVLMQPAPRIGGIGTVRQGCRLLGSIDNPSSEVLGALAFSLVNVVPQPFQDAFHDCEIALLHHGDAAVPMLREMFNGGNVAVNTQLRNIDFQEVVASLRAGAVLSHMTTPAANGVLLEWFRTPQELPVTQLTQMSPEEATAWYDQHGQLFTFAMQGLAYAGTDDAMATIRGLETSEGEGSVLANFRQWFQLSAGAEFGLRTAVHEALAKVGTDADRELLWSRATTGTLVTARGEYFNIEFRKNSLHFVGRGARPGEMERFVALMQAQSRPIEFAMHQSYFSIAELCQDEVACYAGVLDDPTRALQGEAIQATLTGIEDEQARNMVQSGMLQNAQVAAVWQIAGRLGGQPAAAEALLSRLEHDSLQARFDIVEGLHFVDALPADAADRLNTFLEESSGNTQPQMKELRQAVRVLRSMRLSQ